MTFSNNPINNAISTSLVVVYNVEAFGHYKEGFQGKKDIMTCAILTTDGKGIATVRDDKRITLKPNSVFFASYLDLKSIEIADKTWNFLCYWFKPYGLSIPLNCAYNIENLDNSAEKADGSEIISLLQSRKESKINIANAMFMYKITKWLEDIPLDDSPSTKIIDKIIFYINTNLENHIKIGNLSQEFGYCEKHLQNIFKKKLNILPKKYINKVKLEKICGLLLSSSMSLQELADLYDFSSVSHLIYNFKKEFGITPTQYRNNIESEPLRGQQNIRR